MGKLENCADCGKKFGFTERIFSKTNGLWICEDCAITQIQENDKKDQKIADLEAKLAERTEQLKIALKDFNDIQQENDKLAQQLVESEKDRLMWQEMYKSADRQNKSICETDIYPLQEENDQLKQQLISECKEHQEFCKVADEKVNELKQQLAEKEKDLEIKELQVKNLTESCSYAMFCSIVKQKIELEEQLKLAKMGESFEQENKNKALKFQNQTAITELEKVKDKINAYKKEHCLLFVEWDVIEKAVEFIDKQIAQLKGEK